MMHQIVSSTTTETLLYNIHLDLVDIEYLSYPTPRHHQSQVAQFPNHATLNLLNFLHIDSNTPERAFGDLQIMNMRMNIRIWLQ